jgi:hypothetical protein
MKQLTLCAMSKRIGWMIAAMALMVWGSRSAVHAYTDVVVVEVKCTNQETAGQVAEALRSAIARNSQIRQQNAGKAADRSPRFHIVATCLELDSHLLIGARVVEDVGSRTIGSAESVLIARSDLNDVAIQMAGRIASRINEARTATTSVKPGTTAKAGRAAIAASR